jgi:hypothetical protein
MERVQDDVVLVVATLLAAGVCGLLIDAVRAARAEGRRFSSDLGWTLLWVVGLSALTVAAWASRS